MHIILTLKLKSLIAIRLNPMQKIYKESNSLNRDREYWKKKVG